MASTSVNVHIQSSFIERVNYNTRTSNLIVSFRNRTKYIFEGVEKEIAEQLLFSEGSSGKLFNELVKGKYNSFRVT